MLATEVSMHIHNALDSRAGTLSHFYYIFLYMVPTQV